MRPGSAWRRSSARSPSSPAGPSRRPSPTPRRGHRAVKLAATAAELEEHRQALANLATQLTRESEAARQNAEQLEQRIRELVAERDGLQELVADERERFEQTLDALGGGIGRHDNELAELERELEALIAR